MLLNLIEPEQMLGDHIGVHYGSDSMVENKVCHGIASLSQDLKHVQHMKKYVKLKIS